MTSCSPPRPARRPACDPLLITGVVFGALGAKPEPLAFYRELEQQPAFTSPRTWARRRGRYHRTSPAYVEEEVRAALAKPEDFDRGLSAASTRATV